MIAHSRPGTASGRCAIFISSHAAGTARHENSHHAISGALTRASTLTAACFPTISPTAETVSATAETVSAAKPVWDTPRLNDRGDVERRRRHFVGMDIGLGLIAAVAALLLAPGLAIVAVVALSLLAVCSVSLGIDRLRSRRGTSR